MKRTFLIAISFLFSSAVMAAIPAEQVEVVSPSSQLDVKEVVSVDPFDLSDACGITSQTLVFRDSKGALKQVTFKLFGTGCSGG